MKPGLFSKDLKYAGLAGCLMLTVLSCSRPKTAEQPLTDEPVNPPPVPAVRLGDAPKLPSETK
jgi:hypothetical protein